MVRGKLNVARIGNWCVSQMPLSRYSGKQIVNDSRLLEILQIFRFIFNNSGYLMYRIHKEALSRKNTSIKHHKLNSTWERLVCFPFID